MVGAEFPVKAVLDDKGIEMLIAALTKAGKAAGKTDKEIEELNAELRKTGTEGVKSVNTINNSLDNFTKNTLKKVGGAIIATFAVDRLLAFGKVVINITAEFEKFEAVLTNTLGSKGRAQIALSNIVKFAQQTPFSVRELTENFIKLANRGVEPTNDQLRAMGDLAATLGKPFEQVVEAILDINNPERWKEIGIKSETAGNKVKLSFRGVTVEANRTVEGVANAVTELGNLQGVAGVMASVSETLGGKISNMGDAWDQFANTLGDGQSGPLKNAVENLTLLINYATEFIETQDQARERIALLGAADNLENFKALASGYSDVKAAAADYQKILDVQANAAFREQNRAEDEKDIETANLKAETIRQTKIAIEDYVASLDKQAEAQRNAALAADKEKAAQAALAAAKKKAKEQAELLAQIERDSAALDARQEILGGKDPFFVIYSDRIEADTDAALQAMKDRDDALFDQFLANEERLRQAAEIAAEQKLETQAYVRDALIGLSNEVFEFEQAKLAAQSQQIEEQRRYELELAGDNADAKTAINKRFDEEQRALKTKQAQADKEQAIFNILLSTGQGIVAALASVPPNVPLSIAIGSIGGIESGLAASRKIPKFTRGVFDLDGPGTSTSDSIPAWLSKHESVVPAEQSNKFGWLLKPMIEDNIDLLELKQLVDSRVPSHLRGDIMRPAAASDSNALLMEMRETRKAIENKKETYIDIDENGFGKWTRQGNQWTQYVNKRYRS